jgi:hypothetical protein
MLAVRSALEVAALDTVNNTVAVFAAKLACTAAQLPVPADGAHVT